MRNKLLFQIKSCANIVSEEFDFFMLDATYCTKFHYTGRLTKVEEKETGAVSLRTYVDFCKYAGGQIFCFVFKFLWQTYLEPCQTYMMERK